MRKQTHIISCLIIVSTLLLLYSYDKAPNTAPPFTLKFSFYNHSDWTVYRYMLEGNKLNVYSEYLYADSARETLYTTTISEDQILELQSIKLDSLNNYYFNHCILPTSGAEYDIEIGYDNDVKKIHLHHYYLAEIEQITSEIDRHLPKKYKINYLDKDTQQDCR